MPIVKTERMTQQEAMVTAGYDPHWQCKPTKQACKKAGRCICRESVIFAPAAYHMCGEDLKCCEKCAMLAEYECDFVVARGKTCDALLCKDHAFRMADAVHPLDEITAKRLPAEHLRRRTKKELLEDTHFCAAHWAVIQARQALDATKERERP